MERFRVVNELSIFSPSSGTAKKERFEYLRLGKGIEFSKSTVKLDHKEYEYSRIKLHIRATDFRGKFQLGITIAIYIFFAALILLNAQLILPYMVLVIIVYVISLISIVEPIYRKYLKKFMIMAIDGKAVRLLPFDSVHSTLVYLVSQGGGEVKIHSYENRQNEVIPSGKNE